MPLEKVYEPSAWQQEFHDLTHDYALGAGAAGPGKSLCLLMDCNERIVLEHERASDPNHPFRHGKGRSRGWALHLRRTYPMLEQTLERAHKLFRAMDEKVHWSAETHTFTFWSGFKYSFGHCQKITDWEKYQSNQYDWIGFDELTQFDKEQWDGIKTRLRSSDPLLSKMLKVRAMSNPLARRQAGEDFQIRDPHWVRKLFVDPDPAGRKTIVTTHKSPTGRVVKRRRIYLPASLYDNPDKEFVAQYEATLLDSPDHIRAAMLFGNWYISPDSFFGQFWDQRIHVCEPFKVPESWPMFRSMDWGFRAPGCIHWYAVSPEGVLFVVYELNFQLKGPPEVAEMVLAVEEMLGVPTRRGSQLSGPADTQLWEQRGDTGKGKAEEFAVKGVHWVKAAKRRARNSELLVRRLRDHGKGTTQPGIVFFRNCKRAIQVIPAVGTDPKDTSVPIDGGNDHPLDSVLYGCEFASRDRSAAPREEPDEFDDDDVPKPQQPRGRFGYYSTV